MVYSSFPAYFTNPVRVDLFPYFIHEDLDLEKRMDLTMLTQQFLRKNCVMERTLPLESGVESEICQPNGYKCLGQSCTSEAVLSSVKS